MKLSVEEKARFSAVESARGPRDDNQRPVFDPRGGFVASTAEYDPHIHIFSGAGLRKAEIACPARHAVYSPSGRILLASSVGSVTALRTDGASVLFMLSGFPGPLHDEEVSVEAACSPDERRIVCGGCRGFVGVWDAAGTLLHSLSLGSLEITRVEFTGRENTAALCTLDERLALLDADTGRILREADGGGTLLCASADGRNLYLSPFGDSNQVVVWDVESWRPCGDFRLPEGRGCEGMRASPDGSLLAAGGSSGVMLFSLPDRRLLWDAPELSTGYFEDKSLAFSPDSRTLCAGKGAFLHMLALRHGP